MKKYLAAVVAAGLVTGVFSAIDLDRAAHADTLTTGSIRGVVKDKTSGEAGVGATVVATSPALQGEQVVIADETGGYYDSGYIQPVSFFGDGPRVPMMVVSPYARQGFVDHTYTDHVSILKFIEANWRLRPLTSYSEDNMPNATPGRYVPKVRPAIGNLMTMFNFQNPNFGTIKLPVRPAPRPAVHLQAISIVER